MCAYRRTGPLGGGRREHYLRSCLGVHLGLLKCAGKSEGNCEGGICPNCFNSGYLCVLPKVIWNKGHSEEIAAEICVRHFFPVKYFCSVGTLSVGFGIWCCGTCGSVGPGSLGQAPACGCGGFHVGRCLAHGGFAMAEHDVLAVVEHRLILAWVRSEWSRLRAEGLPSIWAPVSQVSSHVVNAGGGCQ